MANYNGFVASKTFNGSTVSQTLGATGVAYSNVADAVPAKFFSSGQFAIQMLNGVSGAIGVQIVGGVGGATYVIAGRTAISAAGGFPVPLVKYVGTSGAVENFGIPRPCYVAFGSAGAVVGFTANVFFAGEYN